MATSQRINEAGWFYHAPSKASNQEAINAPPPSQIPGLSQGIDQTPDDQPKMWIKDTDSPYIQLAKQGGRPDLLRYKSPKPRSEEAKGYPRCDWYYHEDILDNENGDNKGDHTFMLPDYMVHQEWPSNNRTPASGDRRRAPFSYDQKSAFTRESTNPTDKTVKLPELKPSGYGVRNEKTQGKTVKHAPIAMREPIIPHGELGSAKTHHKPTIKADDKILMGKLMGHGYKEDYNTQKDEWEVKQRKVQEKFDMQNRLHKDKMQTEYQEKMATSPTRTYPAAGVTTKRGEHGKQQTSERKGNKTPEKELFKMTKFKKVSAKTDSHRSNPIVHDMEPVEPNAVRQPQPVV